MQAFVTVSQNYYVSNKDILLKTLNNNISNKFKNRMEYNESVNDFIIEINDKQNSEIYDANEFLYPAIVQEGKQAIIDKIAILMLNNCTDWFKITSDGILERPVGLKKIECFDCDMKVYSVILSDNKTYSDFKESIDYFLQSNLKEETENAKNILKRKLNVIFNTDELDIIKHQELIDLECGIFNVYENINSINEDDIKQYVKRIFITQIPINNRKELL